MGGLDEITASGRAGLVKDEIRLWRAVEAFRIAALVYAVIFYVGVQDAYRHPWVGWLVLAVMTVWTGVLAALQQPPAVMIVADLAIAVAAVMATVLADDPARISGGAQTLPSMWAAAPVIGWAVWRGWRTGLVAALAISAADWAEVDLRLSSATLYNIVLLVLAGVVVGYAVQVFRAGRRDLAAAVAIKAATAERERLARGIHDSVLQVLAFVQRRGVELGGEAADLGRMAGEQETRLRALVSSGPAVETAAGDLDLRRELNVLAGARVTVTGPAEPVTLPGAPAEALVAAVTAALDNVRRHAGEQAQAWVLLEDEGDTITVTVRDDGAGIPSGRLAAAEQEGRLGVSQSIRGRIFAVSGTVDVISAPGQGTEIELRVPRRTGP